jgi:hypothetical protein
MQYAFMTYDGFTRLGEAACKGKRQDGEDGHYIDEEENFRRHQAI